jgi:N-succinyldiaminopimelate aminotransferase
MATPSTSQIPATELASDRGLTAARVSAMAPGKLPALLMEAIRLQAVDLALGTPGTPTPPEYVEAATQTLADGTKNQYEGPAGNALLREQIARSLSTAVDPQTELTITVGSTEALIIALLSIVDPGDEVILVEPFYETFISQIALAGGVPRFVPVRGPDWRFDPDELTAAFGPKTRVILLNTPNNPTGHVLDREELAVVAELCERWNVTAISDEVYAGYLFDGHEHVSPADLPELRERTLVVGSLSKSHAMSGWRLGYIRAPEPIGKVLRQMHIAVTAGTSAVLQEAAGRAAAADPDFGRPSDDLRAQRDRAIQVLEGLGASCMPPEGGCYVMADIGGITDEDGEAFAFRLVKEAGVLVVPGGYFYATEGGGAQLIRVAFNRDLSLFDEVERRLAGFKAGAAAAS